MAAISMEVTEASCPGKVLVLGGYCILERPNSGLVLAVSSRFKCRAEWIDKTSAESSSEFLVEITSAQWGGWRGAYTFDLVKGLVPTETSKERNSYVEKPCAWALYCAVSSISPDQGVFRTKKLALILLADNDFYSQQDNLNLAKLPRTCDGLRSLPPNSEVRNKSAKTGLGSSAAMISGLVSCILAHVAGNKDVEYAHRVAQLAHAAVQGKIGSGFDVCSAFYGSMRYVRYDPEPLNASLTAMADALAFEKGARSMNDCAKDDASWDHVVEPCSLPPGMELLCGDVAGGSETPSMSRKILDWRAKSDGSVWKLLIDRNDEARRLINELRSLSASNAKEFGTAITRLAVIKSQDWPEDNEIVKTFKSCCKAFLNVRESLRTVGELSGVPVEPREQQDLCDATMNQVPGVMACGVPGAGGYDAVYALVLGEETAKKVEKFWETYSGAEGKSQVCALLLRESKDAGVVVESQPAPTVKRTKM